MMLFLVIPTQKPADFSTHSACNGQFSYHNQKQQSEIEKVESDAATVRRLYQCFLPTHKFPKNQVCPPHARSARWRGVRRGCNLG